MDEPIDDLLAQGRDEEVKARINALLQQPAETPMPPETAAGVLAAIMATDSANNTPVVKSCARMVASSERRCRPMNVTRAIATMATATSTSSNVKPAARVWA